MLKIVSPPPSLNAPPDIFGAKTLKALCDNGIFTKGDQICGEWWARHLFRSRVPFHSRLYAYGPARWGCNRVLNKIQPGDVVWVSGTSLPNDVKCTFEKATLRKSAFYIFHLLDDWFSQPHQRLVAAAHIPLAHLVTVPTEALRERVLEFFPNTAVEILEEPVDVDRLAPLDMFRKEELPLVVWCGNPYNLKELPNMASILEKVYSQIPFNFRVITGHVKPCLALSIPWQWMAYDMSLEASFLSGAVAGLAPLMDSTYARCKGTNKIKTYLAAGVPSVASAVGYHQKLIRNGETGFLVNSDSEWEEALLTLLMNPSMVEKLKSAARQEAISKYSHAAVIPNWATQLRKHFPNIASN